MVKLLPSSEGEVCMLVIVILAAFAVCMIICAVKAIKREKAQASSSAAKIAEKNPAPKISILGSTANYNYPWDKRKPSEINEYSQTNFLQYFSRKACLISNNPDDFPRGFSYALHIYDPVKMQKLMLAQGLLREATPEEVLNTYTVDKLKAILDSCGLPKSGKKADLILRIAESADMPTLNLPSMCFISDKGKEYVTQHEDLVKLYGNPYGVTYEEYKATQKEHANNLSYNDTIWRVFDRQERFGGCSYNTAYNRAMFLKAESKLQDSLKYYILALAFDANDSSRIVPDWAKDNEDGHVSPFPPALLENIFQLKAYFVPQMVEKCYKYIDPSKVIVSKKDFTRLLDDIFAAKTIAAENYLPKGCR